MVTNMIFDHDVADILDRYSAQEQYDEYLTTHISNVKRGYEWIKENLPDLLDEDKYIEETSYYGDMDEIIDRHDSSKWNKIPNEDTYFDLECEYDAYAEYFYGNDKSEDTKKNFDYAWLSHIHNNPHHWQHWMLQNDEDGLKPLDMPYVFIIEMFCDHWSFSWKSGNLREVKTWYESHKDGILMSDRTRNLYESILYSVMMKLDRGEL